jgi:hypothetical protein
MNEKRFGNTKISTIRRDFDKLARAIQEYDPEATEQIWDEKVSRWVDVAIGEAGKNTRPVPVPRVKPLAWGDEDKNGGFYCNVQLGEGFQAYYDITPLECDLADVRFGIFCHEFGDRVIWRGPKEKAKAAALEHHERRILSALDMEKEE